MIKLPNVMSPDEVAKHFGWSPRKVRELIRKHGLCHRVGNRVVMTEENIKALLEVTKPEPQMVPHSPRGDYAALVRYKERQKRLASKR